MKELFAELEQIIENTYKDGVAQDEAEKLAARFLHAQMVISNHLRTADLDARMRKSGLKTIKSTVYMEAATKGEKKPTEAMLTSIIDSHEIVNSEQSNLDKAEVSKAELERWYDICINSHIYFRNIGKGSL